MYGATTSGVSLRDAQHQLLQSQADCTARQYLSRTLPNEPVLGEAKRVFEASGGPGPAGSADAAWSDWVSKQAPPGLSVPLTTSVTQAGQAGEMNDPWGLPKGVGHLGLPMMGMVLVDPAGPVGLVAQGGLEVLEGPAGQVAQDGLEVLVEVDRRRRRLHRQEATTLFMEPTEQPILGWRLIRH